MKQGDGSAARREFRFLCERVGGLNTEHSAADHRDTLAAFRAGSVVDPVAVHATTEAKDEGTTALVGEL